MADITTGITKECPNCGAAIPVYFGFRTWCEGCGWNIEETAYPVPTNVFERTWRWMGKRVGERLFQQVLRFTDLRPRVTAAMVLTYILALLVHAFTLFLIILAGWLVLSSPLIWDISGRFLSIARVLGAVVLLLVVWKVRPRIARMPADVIRRTEAPTLFRLMDRVAECLSAPRVEAVQLCADHNAGFSRVGLRNEDVLFLGLPLLFALERQELVAVLGHELAHSGNVDPERTWLVHSAIDSLLEWHDLFRLNMPADLRGGGFMVLFSLLVILILRLLSVFSWLAAVFMAVLLYGEQQLAEYRADALSARTGGTAAARNALRKGYLAEAYGNILEKARHYPETRILAEIRERLGCVPDKEFRRIDRLIAKGEAQLGSHPSTKHRMQFLDALVVEAGQVGLTTAEHAKIMQELSTRFEAVEQQIRKALPRPL